MKVLIFGATGSVGRQLVAQALAQHTVTAFTRTPAKLETVHPNLQIVEGDVLDHASVERAVKGQEAVLCSLGAGRKGTVRAEGTRIIIQAMERAGVKRFICQTTLGVGESRGNLNFFWRRVVFGLILRPAFLDHVQQEDYVKRSNLEWTLVRPAAFTNGDRTGCYQHGFAPTQKRLELNISRADVANFMLKQLTDDIYLCKTPGLSY